MAKAELAFRTPGRFALPCATDVPKGFGARARQRRFPTRRRLALGITITEMRLKNNK